MRTYLFAGKDKGFVGAIRAINADSLDEANQLFAEHSGGRPYLVCVGWLAEHEAILETGQRPVMYGIGEREGSSFAMWDGPNPDLDQMLGNWGKSANSCIIKFNADGTEEVLYEWRNGVRWQKVVIESGK